MMRRVSRNPWQVAIGGPPAATRFASRTLLGLAIGVFLGALPMAGGCVQPAVSTPTYSRDETERAALIARRNQLLVELERNRRLQQQAVTPEQLEGLRQREAKILEELAATERRLQGR